MEEATNYSRMARENFEIVEYVMEGGAEKTKLNLETITGDIENNSLVLSYQSLIRAALITSEKVVSETPSTAAKSETSEVKLELEALQQMKHNLDKFCDEKKRQVLELQSKSLSIDWMNCPLANFLPRTSQTASTKQLLPPTPSIVNTIRAGNLEKDTCRHLNLSSPDARLKT